MLLCLAGCSCSSQPAPQMKQPLINRRAGSLQSCQNKPTPFSPPGDTPGRAQGSAASRGTKTPPSPPSPGVGQLGGVLPILGGRSERPNPHTCPWVLVLTAGSACTLVQAEFCVPLLSPHLCPAALERYGVGEGAPRTQGHPLAVGHSSAAQALAECCCFSQRLIFLFFPLQLRAGVTASEWEGGRREQCLLNRLGGEARPAA